jgi:hypothetical protein
MMKLEKTATKYTVEIEPERFIALEEYENMWHGGLTTYEPGLEVILRNMGCDDVEYNGHYQNYIWFSIHVDDDTPEFQAEVLEVINAYLQKALDWLEARGEDDA